MSLLAITLLGAAGSRSDSTPSARELIPGGDFERADPTGWEAMEGSRKTVVGGALRVVPGPDQAKIQRNLGRGLAGRVLVWRGRLRSPGAGDPALIWLYTSDETYTESHWLVQAEFAPGEDWQDFSLVIPVPSTHAVHTIIGAMRADGVIEIDEWTATVRDP